MTYPGDENEENLEEAAEQEEVWEEEEQQFDLADDDEDLPWLEADEYEEEGGFDFRLIWLALIGLAVIAAILFAGWWFTRENTDAELVADGSTIEAPDGAYKQRPDDPGGSEVAGTGDQAFEVAEGEGTRGRVDTDDDGGSARPGIDIAQDSSGEDTTGNAGAAFVQIGAYGSREQADSAWGTQSGRFSALSGLRHRVVEGQSNGATVFRLQAIASDAAAAQAICRSIRSSGGDCIVR